MNIFVKIKNSIYGPEYYKEVLSKPFSYSLKYYLVFSLLLALVFAVFVTIKFFPAASFLATELEKVPEHFPVNLEVVIKDGKASANVEQPYFVKLPRDFKQSGNILQDTSVIENLIVVDTKNKFDLQTFQSYKTVALLTEDSIVYINNENQITIASLSSVKDFTLNREVVSGFIGKVSPFLGILYPLVFVFSYIGGFIALLFEMAYLLFGALLIWLVAALLKLKIGYGKAYQLGLHLITLPVILCWIVLLLPFENPIPFFGSILLILAALLNLRKPAM